MISTPMMLLLTTRDALDPEGVRASVRQIADAGFDGVCMEFRDSVYDEFDPVGQNAMRACCDECRKSGIGFAKTVPPVSGKFLSEHPEMRMRAMRETEAELSGTDLGLTLSAGAFGENMTLTAAFRVTADENGILTSAEKAEVSWGTFAEGMLVRVPTPGHWLFFVSCDGMGAAFAHPGIGAMQDAFMAAYDAFELDGFAMDEFGAGTKEVDAVLSDPWFFERFSRKYGYRLEDCLYLLHHRTADRRFAKVRCDLYTLTTDLTMEYQTGMRKKMERRYGKDLFIGFHHTWWGEGNSGDLWGGNLDYFRLAGALSGGFVDAQYDAERTMLSMTKLAESLGDATTGKAWNMCWDRYCTPRRMEYYHRLLAARNVKWVGHALSRGLAHRAFGVGSIVEDLKPSELWCDPRDCIRREKLLSELAGAGREKAKVAVLYLWEACAYHNSEEMHYHRLSLKALLEKLMLANVPLDVIPGTRDDLDGYEVIFALWPSLLRPGMWSALKKAAARGKKVIFIGPPAEVTTEGEEIFTEFEALTGAHVTEKSTYCGGSEYVAWDLWFTDRVVPMPVYLEGRTIIRAEKGSVRWFGYELPLTDDTFDLIDELREYRTTLSDGVITKLLEDGERKVLLVTSRWSRPMRETFRVDGSSVSVEGGLLAGIESSAGRITRVLTQPGTKVTVNGECFVCEEFL